MPRRTSSVSFAKIRIFERGGVQMWLRNRSSGFTYYSWRIGSWAVRHWRGTLPALLFVWAWSSVDFMTGALLLGLALCVWIAVGVGLRRRAGGAAGRALPTLEEIRQRKTVTRQWPLACRRAHLLGPDSGDAPALRSVSGNGYGTITAQVSSGKIGVPVFDVTKQTATIANVVGCREVTVTETSPGVGRLEFHFRDALSRLVTLADLPPGPTGHVVYGIRADGTPASFNYAQSILIGGLTRNGKSNLVWAGLGDLAAQGVHVDAYVSDPKGGIELDALEARVPLDEDGNPIPLKWRKGPRKLLEVRAYAKTPEETIEMLKAAESAMHARQRELKQTGTRAVMAGSKEMPLVVIILDETLALTELLRKGPDSPLGRIAYTGAAVGYVVWANTQVGQVDALGRFRDLIPQRICFRMPNQTTTDAFMGVSGAECSSIREPGRGFSWHDHDGGFRAFKAAKVTDSEALQIASGDVPQAIAARRREAALRADEESQASLPRRQRKTSVYRIFAEEGHEGIEPGTLAYVGISYQAIDRFMQHDAGFREFMTGNYRIEVEQLPTRDAALQAERDAILNERPLFNKQHNGANPKRRLDWRRGKGEAA